MFCWRVQSQVSNNEGKVKQRRKRTEGGKLCSALWETAGFSVTQDNFGEAKGSSEVWSNQGRRVSNLCAHSSFLPLLKICSVGVNYPSVLDCDRAPTGSYWSIQCLRDTTGLTAPTAACTTEPMTKLALRRLSQLVLSGDRMQLEQSGLTTEGMVRALNRVAWAGKQSTCWALGDKKWKGC